MCDVCEMHDLTRRRVFTMGGAGVAAAGLGFGVAPSIALASETPDVTPEQALRKLQTGNKRFVENALACASDIKARRGEVATSQRPWATILTCSDSRVAPELLFGGATLGELFVIRNAGNLLGVDELGTIEYGAEHLGSSLVLVLGHERCGAVSAACDVATKGASVHGAVGKMIQPLIPIALAAQKSLAAGKGGGDLVTTAVRMSARATARRIVAESPLVAEKVAARTLKVVPAYYDLDTGVVEFAI